MVAREVSRRCQNRNSIERVQREKIAVARDYDVGASVDGELEKLVVGWISRRANRLRDLELALAEVQSC